MEHGAILSGSSDKKQQMLGHIRAVAESIMDDRRGDAVIERYLCQMRHARNYSFRNTLLIAWQAPHSRLVGSLTAFERMAQEQGVPATDFGGKPRRVRQAKGAKAVWILGGAVAEKKVTDDETGEESTLRHLQFFPAKLWAAEEVVYAEDGCPFQIPDFVQPVADEGIYERLLAFAQAKGIMVLEENLRDARGLSTIGTILLQRGDPVALRVAPLIHELAHELLHDRTRRQQMPRNLIEGEAEATAAVVLRALGYDVPVSAAYLRNHGVKSSDVLNSMDRIAKAAGEILDAIAEVKGGAAQAAPGPHAPPIYNKVRSIFPLPTPHAPIPQTPAACSISPRGNTAPATLVTPAPELVPRCGV